MKNLLFSLAILTIAQRAAAYRIDHIMVGVANLESGIAELTKLPGVAPVYGP